MKHPTPHLDTEMYFRETHPYDGEGEHAIRGGNEVQISVIIIYIKLSFVRDNFTSEFSHAWEYKRVNMQDGNIHEDYMGTLGVERVGIPPVHLHRVSTSNNNN